MAITVTQPFYEGMITFVNDVASCYEKFAKRDGVTTMSGALHDMAILREKCNHFQRKFTINDKNHQTLNSNIKSLAFFKTKSKLIEKLFQGIENGLRTKVIGTKTELRNQLRDHFKPIVDDIVQHAANFRVDSSDHDSSSLDNLIKHSTPTVAKIIRAALDASDAESKDLSDKEKDAPIRKALQSYRKRSEELPKTLNGQLFTIVKLPVVPYVDFSLLNPKVLRTSGIQFTSIDGGAFQVFEDQVLLAFDFNYAITDDSGKRKDPSSATYKTVKVPVLGKNKKPMIDADGNIITEVKRVANTNTLKARRLVETHKKMQENFVLDVINRINDRSAVKYTLMSDHFEFNPLNPKIALAWLVPASVHRAFKNAGNLQNAKWGFPWSKMTRTSM